MKNLLITVLIILAICSGCEDQATDIFQKQGNIILDQDYSKGEVVAKNRLGSTSCEILANNPGLVTCIGETRTYSVSHNLSNPQIQWSVVSGNMTILGSFTSATVTVRFNSGFSTGRLLVELDETPFNGVDCGVTYDINSQCLYAPPKPDPIVFDTFTPPNPVGGDFCTTTIANLLEVPPVSCATGYNWTISPSGSGVNLEVNGRRASLNVFNPGSYTVSVKATNCNGTSATRALTLTAVNCGNSGPF